MGICCCRPNTTRLEDSLINSKATNDAAESNTTDRSQQQSQRPIQPSTKATAPKSGSPVVMQPAAPILERQFILKEASCGGYSVKIANFNILAHGLSGIHGNSNSKKAFANLPLHYLFLEYRVPLMLEEIERMDADILVMEEFDLYLKDGEDLPWTHVKRHFQERLRQHRYVEGARQPKRWSPCLNIGENLYADGVVVFYKEDKFELISFSTTEQEAHKRWLWKDIEEAKMQADENGLLRVQSVVELMSEKDQDRMYKVIEEERKEDLEVVERDGVNYFVFESFQNWCHESVTPPSVAIRLVPKDGPNMKPLCIIGTHLVSAKKESGEKQRLSELEYLLSHRNHAQTMEDAHVFVCCDLNASWTDDMGYSPLAYNFMTGGQPGERRFKSAMRGDSDREVAWTSWKKRIKGDKAEELKYTVDFVFYPTTKWRVTSVWDLPNAETVNASVQRMMDENNLEDAPAPLPGMQYPSDHLAICAVLELEQ